MQDRRLALNCQLQRGRLRCFELHASETKQGPRGDLVGGALRSIFISYRRSDSEGEAGRLFDDLTATFSSRAVFMDVSAIEPGRDFRKAIDESVATCSVLLALIGQQWLECSDPAGHRRLEDPNDYVRIELASALQRDIPVIPVLVRAARMPAVDQLPQDLKGLAYRNAVELTHARWKSDVQLLIQALRPHLVPAEGNVANQPAAGVSHGKDSIEFNAPVTPAASLIGSHTIERVSRELAIYVGPISEVLVKRAARKAVSADELYQLAAREIDVEADRARFLKACRD